jgi:hypothetical protein
MYITDLKIVLKKFQKYSELSLAGPPSYAIVYVFSTHYRTEHEPASPRFSSLFTVVC